MRNYQSINTNINEYFTRHWILVLMFSKEVYILTFVYFSCDVEKGALLAYLTSRRAHWCLYKGNNVGSLYAYKILMPRRLCPDFHNLSLFCNQQPNHLLLKGKSRSRMSFCCSLLICNQAT